MQPGQSQSSDGVEMMKEGKNQKGLCVHGWKKGQRQHESIAQWVQGPTDKLQGKRCNSQLRFHICDLSSGLLSF